MILPMKKPKKTKNYKLFITHGMQEVIGSTPICSTLIFNWLRSNCHIVFKNLPNNLPKPPWIVELF